MKNMYKRVKHMKNLKRFLKMISKDNKLSLMIAFLTLIIVTGITLFRPQIIKLILDDAILNKNIGLLIKLILIYIS